LALATVEFGSVKLLKLPTRRPKGVKITLQTAISLSCLPKIMFINGNVTPVPISAKQASP